MKKKIIICFAALCTVLTAGCSGLSSDSSSKTSDTSVNETAGMTGSSGGGSAADKNTASDEKNISTEQAKTIALEDAGLKENNVNFIEAKLEHDDGKTVYDIEFYSENKEYDYEIDAATGEILSCDHDIENYEPPAADNDQNSSMITVENAKQNALEKAGLSEEDVVWKKAELDQDDGRKIYELKFISDQTEYEFEIDAENGSILEYETESV